MLKGIIWGTGFFIFGGNFQFSAMVRYWWDSRFLLDEAGFLSFV